MSTIELSSEDEDECIIVDQDEQEHFQPPHAVFLTEYKFDTGLLKENEFEDAEIVTRHAELGEVSENILLNDLQPQLSDTVSSETDSCDSNRIKHDNVENYLKNAIEYKPEQQDNNVVFQRFAEALSSAISSSKKLTTQCINKQLDFKLTSNENKGFDSENSNEDVVTPDYDFLDHMGSSSTSELIDASYSKINSHNKSKVIPPFVETSTALSKNLGKKRIQRKSNKRSSRAKDTFADVTSANFQKHVQITSDDNKGFDTENIKCEIIVPDNDFPEQMSSLIDDGNYKTDSHSECRQAQPPVNSTVIPKKRGRKRGWKKSPVTDYRANDTSVDGSSKICTIKRQENVKLARDESEAVDPTNSNHELIVPDMEFLDQMDSTNNNESVGVCNTKTESHIVRTSITSVAENSSAIPKKRGRKRGWRKSLGQENSVKDTSKDVYAVNTKMGEINSGGEPTEDTHTHTYSKDTLKCTTCNRKKPGRKFGWRRYSDTNSNAKLVQELNSTQIDDKPVAELDPQEIIQRSKSEEQKTENETYSKPKKTKSKPIKKKQKMKKSNARKSASRTSNSRSTHDYSIISNEDDSSICARKEDTKQVVSNNSCDVLNTNSVYTLNYSTTRFKDSDTTKVLKDINTNNIRNNENELKKYSNSHSSLIDEVQALSKEEFVKCYNKIFDSKAEKLCIRLSDVLLLTMKETKQFTSRINSANKLSSTQLRDDEISICKSGFQKFLDTYRAFFCPVFNEILDHILSKKEAFNLHKPLLLALFIKLFVRITTVSPEFTNYIILAKHAMSHLLKNMFSTLPKSMSDIIYETFWRRDSEFERSCWLILDFCMESYYGDVSSDSSDKEDARTTPVNDNQCINTTRTCESQAGTQQEVAEVSVIVRNKYYQEKQCSKSDDKTYQEPLGNTNLDSSCTKVYLGLNEATENVSVLPLESHQQAKLNSLNEHSETNGNNADKDISDGKRILSCSEEFSVKVAKFAKIQYLENRELVTKEKTEITTNPAYSERESIALEGLLSQVSDDIPKRQFVTSNSQNDLTLNHSKFNPKTNYIDAQNSTSHSFVEKEYTQQNMPFNIPNAEVRGSAQTSTRSCERTGFDASNNVGTNVFSGGRATGRTPTHDHLRAPLSNPYPQSWTQNPVNLLYQNYMDYFARSAESRSGHMQHNHINKQEFNRPLYSLKNDYPVNYQASIRNSVHDNRFNYIDHVSPYPRPTVTVHHRQNQQNMTELRNIQHPYPNYGYTSSQYRPDPKLEVDRIKHYSNNSVMSGTATNIVNRHPYWYPPTQPQQMQNIQSNGSITINNYNVNTYASPQVPGQFVEYSNKFVNSNQYLSRSSSAFKPAQE